MNELKKDELIMNEYILSHDEYMNEWMNKWMNEWMNK